MISKFILWHKKAIKRAIIIVLFIVIGIIVSERLYNSRAVFQTKAEDADYYGILDAGFTTGEKYKEFEYLYKVLDENYPFFQVNERKNKTNWLKNKNKYKRILKNTKGDAEYLVALSTILSNLNDSNTYILTGDTYRRYYLYYYPQYRKALNDVRSMARYNFNGDIRTIDLSSNSNLIYHNEPVLEVKVLVEDKLAYIKIQAMSYNYMEEDYLKIKEFIKKVMHYDKLIIDIRGNSGGIDEYWTKIVALLIDEVHKAEYYSFFRQNSKSKFDDYRITDITSIRELDKSILQQFSTQIGTDFNFYKVNSLEIHPSNDMDVFQGKIYLLVDSKVSSSAEKLAAFAKDTNFATLVGETTGGGMTFEEIPMISMPYGGFVIRYSREMVMNVDGTINMETRTVPHITVEDTTPNEDFSMDTCIQAVVTD